MMTFTPPPRDPAVNPATSNNADLLRPHAAATTAALHGARILLAEDDSVMREYARLLLCEHGASVEAVTDGSEALTVLKRNPPDLALLDLLMPRMTGIELIEHIRTDDELRTLPVILLSGQTSENAKLEGFRVGADDYLTKPYSERELLARVGGQLAMARMRNDMIRRERQLRAEADELNEIALHLTSELDLHSLVQKVTDTGTSLTGAAYGAFFYTVRGEPDEANHLFAVSGIADEQVAVFRANRTTKLFGPTFTETSVVRLDDVRRYPQFEGDVPFRSYLALPVVSASREIVGELIFGHPNAGAFDSRAERLAKGIAAQAAVAIDNARLYERARQEIEERARAEEALRQSQNRYVQLVQALPAAVYTCDAHGRIQLFNDAAVRLWGRTPVAGEDMWCGSHRLYTPNGDGLSREDCPIGLALRTNEPVESREIIIETPAGTRRNVLHHPIPIRDADGTVLGAANMLLDITDQKNAEATRALLAAIVQSSTDAIISTTPDGKITSWNAGAQSLYGYNSDEAIGRNIDMLMPPRRHDEERELFARIRGGERIGHLETTRITRAGLPVEVSLTVSPIQDASGAIVGLSKIARDITAQNAMERALKRSEQQLRLVIDALPAMVSYVDKDLRYRFFNKQLQQWFGIDPTWLQGRTMIEIMGEQSYELIRPYVQRVLSGELVQFEMKLPRDNVMRTVEITYAPDRNQEGRVEGFIGLLNDITARKRTELEIARLNEDLKARIHELETLQEIIPVGVFIAHDAACSVVTANAAARAILNIQTAHANISLDGPASGDMQFTLCRDGKPLPKDDLPLRRCARTQTEVIGELLEIRFRDGSTRQVQVSASPLQGADGEARGCIATVVDITTTIRSERAIRESEQRFRSVAMNAPAAIFIKDLEGAYRMANPLACQMMGRKDVAGLCDHDLMEKAWADKLREHDLKVLVTGESLEFEETIPIDGVTHELLSVKFPLLDAEGRISGVCGVSVDITARKRAENALRQTIERTRLLAGVSEQLLAANDPLAVVNQLCQRVATFIRCDFFAVRMLNDSTGCLDLKAHSGIADSEIPAVGLTELGETISGKVARSGQARIVSDVQLSSSPDLVHARRLGFRAYACHPLKVEGKVIGTLSFASRTRVQFTSDDNALMKTVASQASIAMERLSARQALLDVNATLEARVRDRTIELIEQRRRLQRLAAELTTAEQRERKRLASLLHDDLQQLLVSAKMLMGTLGRRRDNLDDLLTTCSRVQGLIDDSIEAARDMSRQLRPPVLYEDGLVPALQWLASEMYRIHGLEVQVIAAESVEPADDDQRAFLFECVRELLLNIVKHAGVQTATIEARPTNDDALEIVVRDEGRGFDVAAGATDKPAEGFGLFSIRERLASIGGRFEIVSAPGNGTTTIIKAPLPDVRIEKERPVFAPGSYPDNYVVDHGKGVRVLVVDDHALVREGIASMIGDDGDFSVVAQAGDGVEAIQAVERCSPDIVLMDLNMPRMNGIEATRLIRRQWPGMIIVGLSVQEDETTANSVLDAGASVFLSKASTPDQILTTMRKLVSQRQSAS